MTTEQLEAVVEATKNLTVDELADLVNHLGDGTLAEIQKEPWNHHIEHLLSPIASDTDAIHTLWVLLIDVHDRRYQTSRQSDELLETLTDIDNQRQDYELCFDVESFERELLAEKAEKGS